MTLINLAGVIMLIASGMYWTRNEFGLSMIIGVIGIVLTLK